MRVIFSMQRLGATLAVLAASALPLSVHAAPTDTMGKLTVKGTIVKPDCSAAFEPATLIFDTLRIGSDTPPPDPKPVFLVLTCTSSAASPISHLSFNSPTVKYGTELAFGSDNDHVGIHLVNSDTPGFGMNAQAPITPNKNIIQSTSPLVRMPSSTPGRQKITVQPFAVGATTPPQYGPFTSTIRVDLSY